MPVERMQGACGTLPFVSVVVPAYNAARTMRTCLAPLIEQTYPLDRYEIILVDDGSRDGLAQAAREVVAAWPGRFTVINKPNGGPASARNAGIRASQADIVAFTDADCAAAPDWVEQLVTALTCAEVAGVGGPIVNMSQSGWVARYLESGHFYRHRTRRGEVDYLLTANVAFRRAALLRVGGFAEEDSAWCEDADLSFRLKQDGYRLLLTNRGVVTHFGTPASVRGLVKDLYRYGRGNFLLSRRWRNGRAPAKELARHAAAFELALWLALARARRVGLWWALSFWPLIMVEHGAFIAGMLGGMAHRMGVGGGFRGRALRQRHHAGA